MKQLGRLVPSSFWLIHTIRIHSVQKAATQISILVSTSDPRYPINSTFPHSLALLNYYFCNILYVITESDLATPFWQCILSMHYTDLRKLIRGSFANHSSVSFGYCPTTGKCFPLSKALTFDHSIKSLLSHLKKNPNFSNHSIQIMANWVQHQGAATTHATTQQSVALQEGQTSYLFQNKFVVTIFQQWHGHWCHPLSLCRFLQCFQWINN